jgi:hypothetical protein
MISMKYTKNKTNLINIAKKHRLHFNEEDQSGICLTIKDIKRKYITDYHSAMLFYNKIPISFILISYDYYSSSYVWSYYTKESHRKNGYMKKLIAFMKTNSNLSPSVYIEDMRYKNVREIVSFMRHNNFPRYQDLNK